MLSMWQQILSLYFVATTLYMNNEIQKNTLIHYNRMFYYNIIILSVFGLYSLLIIYHSIVVCKDQ